MKINTNIIIKNKYYILASLLIIIVLVFFNEQNINKESIVTSLSNNEIDISKLVINEIMTSNKGVHIDNEGDSYDYIEIYNGTNEDINLLNYGLSDREDGKVKWLFPDIIINKNSYIVVYLTGEKKEGLYADFALKDEGGELVTLKKPNGKVVDSVKTIPMNKNCSMSRDKDGKWIVTEEITPGFQNNESGRAELLYAASNLTNEEIIISEVLPSNEGNVIFDNKLYSYIEITNISDDTINLNNYYLSNDKKALFKWRLPSYNLASNESFLIFTNKLNVENNASFELKHKNGLVLLSKKDGIIDELEYEDLTNGVAYIKENDRWYQSSNISPGFPNNTKGKVEYQKKYDEKKESLIINEIMNSNTTYLAQNGNQFYDWIELYNNSKEEIELSNYSLTTNKDDTAMYKLPKITLKPNEYYILMASGDISLSNTSYEHTNFKISNGEGLFLYKENDLIDSLFIYNVPKNNSYGRGDLNGHYYYQTPTPKEKNNENGIREISNVPVFNKNGGIYNNVGTLEIKITGQGDIFYTTDGSTPNNNSKKYDQPILIDKTTVIKAISYEKDKSNSEVITNTYIVNENHSLPVVSLSLEKENLSRITNNPRENITVNSHIEFYDDNSSFSIDCGMKIFGGLSRTYNKKSYSLKFSKEYGGSLHYKVFDNKEIVEFNDLVLRSGSQEQTSSMIRDEFVSTLAVNYTNIDAQAARPTVLYINGEYYGVYFIREKINNNFILRNHNVNGESNIINAFYYTTENGNSTPFWNLRNYSNSHDLSTKESYEYIKTILDVENYADYYVLEYILCNYDLLNIRMYTNSNINNGKVRIILYDSDYALRTDSGAYFLDYMQDPYYLNPKPDMSTLIGLLKNVEFRKLFIQRMSYFMKNVWTKEHIEETYNYFYNSIEKEMERDSIRWNHDYQNFKNSAERMKNMALSKIDKMKKYMKTYFQLTTEEYNEYFG